MWKRRGENLLLASHHQHGHTYRQQRVYGNLNYLSYVGDDII